MLLLWFALFFQINQAGLPASTDAIVTVQAANQWSDTRVMVRKDDRLWFAVSPESKVQCLGQSVNADGIDIISNRSLPVQDARVCSLIGKISENGKAFPIGLSEDPVSADGNGKLFLGINTDQLDGNTGNWSVFVNKSAIRRKLVSVPATEAWTPTDIKVRSDSHVVFLVTPDSRINCDRRPTSASPDGVVPVEPELGRPVSTFGACGLIGKIDDRQPFKVGSNPGPFSIQDSGSLFLGINDTTLEDNSGAFRVLVVVF
jgi:hypothetical protein